MPTLIRRCQTRTAYPECCKGLPKTKAGNRRQGGGSRQMRSKWTMSMSRLPGYEFLLLSLFLFLFLLLFFFFFARGAIKYFCICLCIAGYLPLCLCVCVRMLLCLYLCTLYKHMLIGRNWKSWTEHKLQGLSTKFKSTNTARHKLSQNSVQIFVSVIKI